MFAFVYVIFPEHWYLSVRIPSKNLTKMNFDPERGFFVTCCILLSKSKMNQKLYPLVTSVQLNFRNYY